MDFFWSPIRPAHSLSLRPRLSALLVGSPAIPPFAFQLPTVLAWIQTEGPTAFAFAFLSPALATVSGALLWRLQDRDLGRTVTVAERSLESILVG
jgi:hypothetical protein